MSDFKRQILINLSIALASSLVFGGLIFYFVYDVNGIASRISAIRESAKVSENEVKNLLTLKREANEASVLSQSLRFKLPTRYDLLSFPKEAGKLAKGKNISFEFSFGAEVTGSSSTPSNIGFAMNLGGEIKQALDFLRAIESSVNLLRVNTVDVSGGSSVINGELFFK